MMMYAALVIKTSLLVGTALCLTTKRRLCVEFRKENYFIGGEHLELKRTETENLCMTSCARYHPCMAFNCHAVNQTCILLPEVECMPLRAPDNSSGYVFVHLSSCKFQPVYTSVRPADGNWYWSNADNPSTEVVILIGKVTRYASRMLYRGYYLLGWWSSDGFGFRAIDPINTQILRCPDGEFLAFPDPSVRQWTPYVPGDALPDFALPISELPDGTPLYIVRHTYFLTKKHRIAGFYNHVTKSTYFVKNGISNAVSRIDILCGTNIWGNDFNESSCLYPLKHAVLWV